MSDIDHQGARTANGFEPWPGADQGRPSAAVADWLLNVLEPGKRIMTAVMGEAGLPSSRAHDAASVIVARLAHHDPPLTIERIQ